MGLKGLVVTTPKHILIGIAFVFVVALIVTGVIFGTPSTAPAAPTITWTPSSVTETIVAGESRRLSISFTTSENISSAVARVVPEIQPFVYVTPQSVGPVSKGQAFNLEVTLSAPLVETSATLQGTIHVIHAAGKNSKTFAKPLPVTLTVRSRSTAQIVNGNSAIGICYHPDWTLSGTGPKRRLYSPVSNDSIAQGSLVTPPDITLTFLSNSSGFSLSQFMEVYRAGWFSTYKDQVVGTRAGRESIRVSDLGAAIRRVPELAAFVRLNGAVLLITGHEESEQEFDNILNCLEVL
jgi:hypothetical protein